MTSDRKGIFEQLHLVAMGQAETKSATIEAYENLPANEGLKQALVFVNEATSEQETARSDFLPRLWGNDVPISIALLAIFIHLAEGGTMFPELPCIERISGKASAALQLWAIDLISDHDHVWEHCYHSREQHGLASHQRCNLEAIHCAGFLHILCAICGINKYDTRPLIIRAQQLSKVR